MTMNNRNRGQAQRWGLEGVDSMDDSPQPKNLFAAPRKKAGGSFDSDVAKSILGDFDSVKDILLNSPGNLVGIQPQPQTPVLPKGQGPMFPPNGTVSRKPDSHHRHSLPLGTRDATKAQYHKKYNVKKSDRSEPQNQASKSNQSQPNISNHDLHNSEKSSSTNSKGPAVFEKPEKTAPKNMLPNGLVNGQRKNDSKAHEQPKLKLNIPSKERPKGSTKMPEPIIENLFKEYHHPPLLTAAGIQTPKKDTPSKFAFPIPDHEELANEKDPAESSGHESDAKKSKEKTMKGHKTGHIDSTALTDLQLSSDSENEEPIHRHSRKNSSTSDGRNIKRRSRKNTVSTVSSSSDDSSSNSDSSSDSESSSDNEITPKPTREPSPQAKSEPSWGLGEFKQQSPEAPAPVPEVEAPPPSNLLDNNDSILDSILGIPPIHPSSNLDREMEEAILSAQDPSSVEGVDTLDQAENQGDHTPNYHTPTNHTPNHYTPSHHTPVVDNKVTPSKGSKTQKTPRRSASKSPARSKKPLSSSQNNTKSPVGAKDSHNAKRSSKGSPRTPKKVKERKPTPKKKPPTLYYDSTSSSDEEGLCPDSDEEVDEEVDVVTISPKPPQQVVNGKSHKHKDKPAVPHMSELTASDHRKVEKRKPSESTTIRTVKPRSKSSSHEPAGNKAERSKSHSDTVQVKFEPQEPSPPLSKVKAEVDSTPEPSVKPVNKVAPMQLHPKSVVPYKSPHESSSSTPVSKKSNSGVSLLVQIDLSLLTKVPGLPVKHEPPGDDMDISSEEEGEVHNTPEGPSPSSREPVPVVVEPPKDSPVPESPTASKAKAEDEKKSRESREVLSQILGPRNDKGPVAKMPKIPKRKPQPDSQGSSPKRKKASSDPQDAFRREVDDGHRKNPRRSRDRRGSNSSTSSRVSSTSSRESRRPLDSQEKRDWDQPDHVAKGRDWDAPYSPSEPPQFTMDHLESWKSRVEQRGNGNHVNHTPPPPQKPEKIQLSSAEKLKSQDYYRSEATKHKHQADAMKDKMAKCISYTEAVVWYILGGYAMEHSNPKTTKEVYSMYEETLNLLKYTFAYKLRPDQQADIEKEKKLTVLRLRINALLCLKLYKLKKSEASKLKRALDEHNRTAGSMVPAQAPSPYHPPSGGKCTTGTPSPMSPTPSPAGSVGSVGSVGSACDSQRMMNGTAQPAVAVQPGTLMVPQRIHTISQQYLSIVNNLVKAHDRWDEADAQAKEFHEFFDDIDNRFGPLTLHSSLWDLGQFMRQAIARLKDT